MPSIASKVPVSVAAASIPSDAGIDARPAKRLRTCDIANDALTVGAAPGPSMIPASLASPAYAASSGVAALRYFLLYAALASFKRMHCTSHTRVTCFSGAHSDGRAAHGRTAAACICANSAARPRAGWGAMAVRRSGHWPRGTTEYGLKAVSAAAPRATRSVLWGGCNDFAGATTAIMTEKGKSAGGPE